MKTLLLIFLMACTSERHPSGQIDPEAQERQADSDMYSGEASVRETSP